MTNWLAEHSRITVFRVPGSPLDATAVWDALVKEQPTTINTTPATKTVRIEGLHEFGQLVFQVDQVRADWFLVPRPLTDLPQEAPNIGRFDDVALVLARLVKPWIS